MTPTVLLEGFLAACAAVPRADRLAERRAEAFAFLAERGLPTARDEEWRFTDLSRITGLPVELPPDLPAAAAARSAAPEGDEILLVLVDGVYRPELSRLEGLPAGCLAGGIARFLDEDGAAASLIVDHAGRVLPPAADAFAAANTALFPDGAFLRLPRGVSIGRPVRILSLSSSASFPRVLVVAEPGSRATIVEEQAALDPDRSAPVIGVVEAIAGEAARLQWVRMQTGLSEVRLVSSFRARVAAAASLTVSTFTLAPRFVRNTASIVLEGPAAECTLDGLYLAGTGGFVDNHTAIEHRAPRCPSHELYKGVLFGDARAVFNGKVHVTPEAQGTDAKQTNRNLLLSDAARIHTKPQLEIFADDVKCTHGATVGQLDDEALFYLKSRALPDAAARRVLVRGFADEMIGRIGEGPVARRLETLTNRMLEDAMEAAS